MYIVKKQSQDEATVKSDELYGSKRAALSVLANEWCKIVVSKTIIITP
ncbi:hypothetical protein BH10CYA1_BH10CYA1_08790 [soil metagenome]